jgi:hypothetical protein
MIDIIKGFLLIVIPTVVVILLAQTCARKWNAGIKQCEAEFEECIDACGETDYKCIAKCQYKFRKGNK